MSLAKQTDTPRIGIIISMFPELHETFILRELVALEKHGLQFDIYSLQHPRDPITIDDAIRLSQERSYYSRLVTLATLSALFKNTIRHPIILLSSIAKVCWQGRDRPMDVIKNLAILPLSLHIADIGKQRGVVHWHGHWANIPTTACWYISRFSKQRWSAAIHGEDIFSANGFLKYKLDAAAFSVVCSGYFCHHLKTQIGLQQPEHVHLNYHGLDPRVVERKPYDRTNNDSSTVTLVSIGRMVPTKGHDVLINALASIKGTFDKSVKLKFIGSGPIEQTLKNLSQQQGVASDVEFCGAMAFEDVLQTLESADLFCLAPRLIPGHPPDGIPNVIAEAMALGVPVLTTRVSAIPELVEDGVSGKLVEANDVAAFAQALTSLINDSQMRETLGEAARQKVDLLFNQQNNIRELLELFDQYVPQASSCYSERSDD
ncbi:MAG: glycosyltransferase family 4 protein [Granulosicoccaceae bacterium]